MYGRDGICSLKSYMTWIVRFSVILLKKLVPHFLIQGPQVLVFFQGLQLQVLLDCGYYSGAAAGSRLVLISEYVNFENQNPHFQ